MPERLDRRSAILSRPRRRRRIAVVEVDHAAGVARGEHAREDRVRDKARLPVAGVYVREDRVEPELRHDRQYAVVGVKPRWPEQARPRPEDLFDRGDALFDLPPRLALVQVGQSRVREGVAADLMAVRDDRARFLGVLAHALADQEERRARVVVAEQLPDHGRPLRGTVVECQREPLQAARTNNPAAAFSPSVRSLPSSRTFTLPPPADSTSSSLPGTRPWS